MDGTGSSPAASEQKDKQTAFTARKERERAGYAYLDKHGVRETLQAVINSLLGEQPADPLAFMIDALQRRQRSEKSDAHGCEPLETSCRQLLQTLDTATSNLQSKIQFEWSKLETSQEFMSYSSEILKRAQSRLRRIFPPGESKTWLRDEPKKWVNLQIGRRDRRFKSLSQVVRKVVTERNIVSNWKKQMKFRGEASQHMVDAALPTSIDVGAAWGAVNVLQLEKESGKPLSAVFMSVWDNQGLRDVSKAPRNQVSEFIAALENKYEENPYHSRSHAASTCLAAFYYWNCIGNESNMNGFFDEVDLLALLVAAAIHDVAHPGVGNDFLVRTCDTLSIRYHERSVLEHFHAATGFELMRDMKIKLLEHHRPSPPASRVRGRVVDMVLATDMSHHGQLANAMSAQLEACSSTHLIDKHILEQNFLHLADIGHPLLPFEQHHEWSARITQEFFMQGDKELELGMEPATLFDRSKAPSLAEGQLGFLNFVLAPTWTMLKPLLGEGAIEPDRCFQANLVEWQTRKDQQNQL